MNEPLAAGLYEALMTDSLRTRLAMLDSSRWVSAALDGADDLEALNRHLSEIVRTALTAESNTERRHLLINRLLDVVATKADHVSPPAEQLLGVLEEPTFGVRPTLARRPATPFSDSALLTNARDEPGLGSELRAELESADSVDLLCAFIRWHGIRILEQALTTVQERGSKLRVITTTYMGATERKAIDALVSRYGAEVRISYETLSTRLHAKAWLFRRNTGLDTAYVGSSNLSKSALVDGLEWNVRISGVSSPALLQKFKATFDSYWEDAAFVPYNPDQDAKRLDEALSRAGSNAAADAPMTLAGLEVRPYPHQEEILESLRSERLVRDRHRNLVIAATGTGKTVVAALDYRQLARAAQGDLSLLFVAHRSEILQQSVRTYREVMVDGSFGELYVGGQRPDQWRHVFASVQSINAYGVDRITPDQFDVIVIDEFHHAEATTYRRLLDRLRPLELLGLTATPERGDGIDVRSFFDGRAAAELRLWDALDADLLVPFHYFGVADDVDLSSIEWKRGGYVTDDLDRLYTGNDARAAKVLREVRDKVSDPGRMRAIGFCVSVAHATYMARLFTAAGVPAQAVSGTTSAAQRAAALNDLRAGRVNCLFAADLYNEGLDLPEIDTILLLRPTQSATVFLQQLGRGLRRAEGKAVLTVLDFIGQQRREFRFDVRFRALTGISQRQLVTQVEQQFPFLPAGSQIVLDRVSSQIILNNIKAQVGFTRRQLIADVQWHGDLTLGAYLAESQRELPDIYRRSSWTEVRREAGLPTANPGPKEGELLKRMKALVQIDDPERAEAYVRLAESVGPSYEELTDREQRLARMLFFTLCPNGGGYESYDEWLNSLRTNPAVAAEIAQVAELGMAMTKRVPESLGEGLQQIPVRSHASYRREEILSGFGWAGLDRTARGSVTGVVWCDEVQTDLLLINLHKSEADFSPNTMYRDFALGPDLFHWETQNSTSIASATGQRYVNQRRNGTHVVIFVRNSPSGELGSGAPFICLGQADYVSHVGERPIAITWRLRRPMPADIYVSASAVAR